MMLSFRTFFHSVFVPQLHNKLEGFFFCKWKSLFTHMYFSRNKGKVSGTSVSLGIAVFHLCILVPLQHSHTIVVEVVPVMSSANVGSNLFTYPNFSCTNSNYKKIGGGGGGGEVRTSFFTVLPGSRHYKGWLLGFLPRCS